MNLQTRPRCGKSLEYIQTAGFRQNLNTHRTEIKGSLAFLTVTNTWNFLFYKRGKMLQQPAVRNLVKEQMYIDLKYHEQC
jgi:hypothetical protein